MNNDESFGERERERQRENFIRDPAVASERIVVLVNMLSPFRGLMFLTVSDSRHS